MAEDIVRLATVVHGKIFGFRMLGKHYYAYTCHVWLVLSDAPHAVDSFLLCGFRFPFYPAPPPPPFAGGLYTPLRVYCLYANPVHIRSSMLCGHAATLWCCHQDETTIRTSRQNVIRNGELGSDFTCASPLLCQRLGMQWQECALRQKTCWRESEGGDERIIVEGQVGINRW